METKIQRAIIKLLKENKKGLSIAEIYRATKFMRITITVNLLKLELQNLISHKVFGQTKVYYLSQENLQNV